MATTFAKLVVFLIAFGRLFLQAMIVVLLAGAAMLIPYDLYKSKGGKKSYSNYCYMVLDNLLELFNEWLEQLFE